MSEKSIYLICGDDEYLVSKKAKEIIGKLVPESEKAFKLDGVTTTYGTDGYRYFMVSTLVNLRNVKKKID